MFLKKYGMKFVRKKILRLLKFQIVCHRIPLAACAFGV